MTAVVESTFHMREIFTFTQSPVYQSFNKGTSLLLNHSGFLVVEALALNLCHKEHRTKKWTIDIQLTDTIWQRRDNVQVVL